MEVTHMDKNKRINIILTALYIPMSLIGFLFPMGTDGIIDETKQTIIIWTKIYCYLGFFTFAICAASLLLGNALYKKNRTGLSYFVRFIPILLVIATFAIDVIIVAM